MARLARLILLAATVAAAVVLGGCGNRVEVRTLGETEGLYLDIGELKYQVQISRYLNAADVEDRAYLAGLPSGTQPPAGDETWFGVWLRVQNETEEAIAPAASFEIEDTQGTIFRPVPLDPKANAFAYQPIPVPPRSVLPLPDSAAAVGPVQGSLLLFKVKTASLQNRPLEFRFESGGTTGIVDLDV